MNSVENNNERSIESLFGRQATVSSFDIMGLLTKVWKYWYWFVICLVAALVLAYVRNRSWTPTYKSVTTILIEESRSSIRNDFTTGYSPLGYGNRYLSNEMLMYNSYDFVANTVDRLHLTAELYEKSNFRKRHIVVYQDAPILIDSYYIADEAYGLEFKINGIDSDTYEISFAGNKQRQAFRLQGKYDVPLQHSLFFAEVRKTTTFVNPEYDLFFHFFSKKDLISLYSGSMYSRVLMEGSSVIEVSITGKVPQRDLDFLNLLNEQFFQENLDHKNEAAERSIQFIDQQIAILRDSIDAAETKLNDYQQASGIYSPDQSGNRVKVLEELEKNKNEIRLRKEYLKYLSNYMSNPRNELLTDPSAFQINNPRLSAYISQYNELALSLQNLGPSSPIYSNNLKAMEEIRSSIRDAIHTMNSMIALEESDNNQRYGKIQNELANMPQQERQLLTHERDFKINDTYYTYLLQRRTESQIQKASNSPDNYIIDKPRVLGIVNKGDKHRTYILYVLTGLLLPLIFVACKEFLFKFHIQSREDIERITKFPLLGTIERLKEKELLAVKAHPRSSFAEGFRAIRSRMDYMVPQEGAVSMLLTSTEPQDGKTFVALNLAAIYQMSGKKVIVADFDLRRPALSELLGLEQKAGLSNYLIGQVSLDNAIVTLEEGYDILPAGAIPPNPSELIRTQQARDVISTLTEKYDYVILDCSPLGLVADAHYLAHLVDIVLYVVRDEKTSKNFFQYTIRELQADRIANVAIVYNDVDTNVGYYGKSSYYLKHNSYYHEK